MATLGTTGRLREKKSTFRRLNNERDDASYILDMFPSVRERNLDQAGVILAIYDAMTTAVRTGVPYVTRLDPFPADPRNAHPPRPPATEQA